MNNTNKAFTIIELLIVIVIIAILVAITAVGFNGITKSAKEASAKSDLKQAATQLEVDKAKSSNNQFPNNTNNLKTSPNNNLEITSDGTSYCLSVTSTNNIAPYSICPKNWRLPTGGYNADWSNTVGDFPDLDRAFGGTGQYAWSGEANIAKWQNTGPFKGVFSGNWYGSFDGQGSYGYWWSSSASTGFSLDAVYAYVGPDEVNPGGNGSDRSRGVGVRCLLN